MTPAGHVPKELLCLLAQKTTIYVRITNFIVLPMTFLSGTFYSISRLPELWQNLSAFNPFFYNIDGFRYAFIGKSDSSLLIGSASLIIINLILFFLCYLMFRSGYKLKS